MAVDGETAGLLDKVVDDDEVMARIAVVDGLLRAEPVKAIEDETATRLVEVAAARLAEMADGTAAVVGELLKVVPDEATDDKTMARPEEMTDENVASVEATDDEAATRLEVTYNTTAAIVELLKEEPDEARDVEVVARPNELTDDNVTLWALLETVPDRIGDNETAERLDEVIADNKVTDEAIDDGEEATSDTAAIGEVLRVEAGEVIEDDTAAVKVGIVETIDGETAARLIEETDDEVETI
ncbi:hypothetical protein MBLNU459_g7906t1 [Dothideomycetes sp. NU459]